MPLFSINLFLLELCACAVFSVIEDQRVPPPRQQQLPNADKEVPNFKPKNTAWMERPSSKENDCEKEIQKRSHILEQYDNSANSSTEATKFMTKQPKQQSNSFLGSIFFKRGFDHSFQNPINIASDQSSNGRLSNASAEQPSSYGSSKNMYDQVAYDTNSNMFEDDSNTLKDMTGKEIVPIDYDYGRPSDTSDHLSNHLQDQMGKAIVPIGYDYTPIIKASDHPSHGSYDRAKNDRFEQNNSKEFTRAHSDSAIQRDGKMPNLSNLAENIEKKLLKIKLDIRLWKLRMKDGKLTRTFVLQKNRSNQSDQSNVAMTTDKAIRE